MRTAMPNIFAAVILFSVVAVALYLVSLGRRDMLAASVASADEQGLPFGVTKFEDGSVVCYLYKRNSSGSGISCLETFHQ